MGLVKIHLFGYLCDKVQKQLSSFFLKMFKYLKPLSILFT